MPTNETRTVRLDGDEIEIEHLDNRPGGGARLDIEHPDGRRWRVQVTGTGKLDEVETTWRDDQLADLDEPDWMDDILARASVQYCGRGHLNSALVSAVVERISSAVSILLCVRTCVPCRRTGTLSFTRQFTASKQ
jgi:hypothetical protein